MVAVVFVAALVVRQVLWRGSLFEDELATYSVVTGNGLGGVIHTQYGHTGDLTPPLYHMLAWLSLRLGSTREMLRLPSLVAGVAAIPLVFLLGRRIVGVSAGAVAAVLLAVSPYQAYFGSEARPYALVMALGLGSTLALVCAVEADSGESRLVGGGRRGGPGWGRGAGWIRWAGSGRGAGWLWAAYAVLTAAAVYTVYTAVFLAVAQGLFAFVRFPWVRRPLVVWSLVAACLFAPWIPAVIRDSTAQQAALFRALSPLSASGVIHALISWAVSDAWAPASALPGHVGIALILAGVLVGLGGLVVGFPDFGGGPWRLLPLVCAIALPVGLLLFSLVVRDIWDTRQLITSAPALALLVGQVITAGRLRVWLVSAVLIAAGLGVGTAMMLRRENFRPNYAAAVGRVIAGGSRSDPVAVIGAPGPGPLTPEDAAFAYSGQAGRPLLRLGTAPLSVQLAHPRDFVLPVTPARVLAARAVRRGAARIWVIAPGAVSLRQLEGGGVVRDFRLGRNSIPGLAFLLSNDFRALSRFVRATRARYRPYRQWVYPGMMNLSVYELRRR